MPRSLDHETRPSSSNQRSPTTSRNTRFFAIHADPYTLGSPTRRQYVQEFGDDPSFGSPPLFDGSANTQCTCPLFSSPSNPGSPTTLCVIHTDAGEPVSPHHSVKSGNEMTSAHGSRGTVGEKSLKRKCMSDGYRDKGQETDGTLVQSTSPPLSVPRLKPGSAAPISSRVSQESTNAMMSVIASFERFDRDGPDEERIDDDTYPEQFALSPESE